MRVWLVAYSRRGSETAERIAAALEAGGHSCRCFAREDHRFSCRTEALMEGCRAWTGRAFCEAEAVIFCCAAGIAVRSIAPYVVGKDRDPAVVVVDETGAFAIPILSGHLGGANALALEVARGIGAAPVVTTATDLHGIFAVDSFAKENYLTVSDLKLAKRISAALLRGERIGFQSQFPCKGKLPDGLVTEGHPQLGICVSEPGTEAPFPETLYLRPRPYVAGLGCRRGKDPRELEAFFLARLEGLGLGPLDLRCLATIDIKGEEPALRELSRRYRLPLRLYSGEALRAVPGSFHGSEFVLQTVGVDSVCERAAVLASGGRLIMEKTAESGMTMALARCEEALHFE